MAQSDFKLDVEDNSSHANNEESSIDYVDEVRDPS